MINIKKSLSTGTINYKDESVRKKVRDEFLKKCYMCEGTPIQNYEIDHFYPQNIFPHLINSYENLFYICSKCNKIRPKDINTSSDNEVLDNTTDDVEKYITLDVSLDECKKAIITANYTGNTNIDKKVDNTIFLLEKIYNGKGTTSESYICLKDDIVDDVIQFLSDLVLYEDDYKGTQFESRFKNKLLIELDKSSKYSSFKNTIFKKKGFDETTF